MLDLHSYIKKYVWDANKTPYFVRVNKLNQNQADHELFAYTFFIGLLFGLISVISLTENAPHGKSYPMALYAFSVAGSAVLFSVTRHIYAAYYFTMAPLATLLYLFYRGFPPNFATIDKIVVVAITLGLLCYSMRFLAIAKAYHHLPQGDDGG